MASLPEGTSLQGRMMSPLSHNSQTGSQGVDRSSSRGNEKRERDHASNKSDDTCDQHIAGKKKQQEF